MRADKDKWGGAWRGRKFAGNGRQMIDATLTIDKAEVMDEVAKTTAYEGKKTVGDDGAYERIFATAEDRAMLGRFWDEAASAATESMKRFLVGAWDTYSAEEGGKAVERAGYTVRLELSGSYDTALTPSVEKSLFSFFVNAIVGKWNSFVKEGQVDRYESEAAAALQDIMSKLFYRRKPTRRSVG